tara:strand:- start:6531 stop:6863 length:333 start_codon:yes stop_codon:yes gene_type:complete
MAVTTKEKYKTSDNKYYDTEKEATISQNRINSTNLVPWRTEQYDKWLKTNSGLDGNGELKELRDSRARDGDSIQSIVCGAIIAHAKDLNLLAALLSHPSSDEEEEEEEKE